MGIESGFKVDLDERKLRKNVHLIVQFLNF
jgi:hypothetical protein